MQSACRTEVPNLPRWADRIKRRSQGTYIEVQQMSQRAKEELPRLAVIPKVWCVTVSALLLSMFFLIALQYAGIVEVQYELTRRQNELVELGHQKAEMGLVIEQLSSLERIDREARSLGMEYPTNLQVVRLNGIDSGHINVAASRVTNGVYGN